MATAPTTPPADGPALPTPPTTEDPENFDTRMDDWLVAQGDLQTEMQAAKDNVFENAEITFDNAEEAAASATSAASSEANAAAMANFKGLWSAQTGALNKPASVDHNGAFWGLLNNLANVTTSEPGVSADWVVVGGAWPLVDIATNTTAVPRRTYVFTAACTLTAPAISDNGKQFGIVVPPGVTGAIFAPAGADKTRGASGSKTITAPFSVVLTDSGATLGWI